jgi:hypothetical protein
MLANMVGNEAQELIHPPTEVLNSLPVDEKFFRRHLFANYANFCGSLEESVGAADWQSQADVLDSTLLACSGFLIANRDAPPPKMRKFAGIDT